jgi:hypothetical protein
MRCAFFGIAVIIGRPAEGKKFDVKHAFLVTIMPPVLDET